MKTKNAILLFLTAFIWGTAFVAQSVGMDHLGPFAFNGIRNLIGAAALLPCIVILKKFGEKKGECGEQGGEQKESGSLKELLLGGICCGICLFGGTTLQQIGLQYTTAGKAGFITAFYIVLVPVLGIFLRKKIGWKVWLAVAVALTGLYFLCITDSFSIGKGDFFVLLGAFSFTVHIMVIDHFAVKVDGVKMSCIQFLVVGLISLPIMMILEPPTFEAIRLSLTPLLYTGVMSCGVAYTLQIIGQKGMNPAIASLIMSLESSISVLAGWVILGEKLTMREGFGCVLMFAAIILAQIPDRKGTKN